MEAVQLGQPSAEVGATALASAWKPLCALAPSTGQARRPDRRPQTPEERAAAKAEAADAVAKAFSSSIGKDLVDGPNVPWLQWPSAAGSRDNDAAASEA